MLGREKHRRVPIGEEQGSVTRGGTGVYQEGRNREVPIGEEEARVNRGGRGVCQ